MPTRRIDATFARLRAANQAAFVAYLCAGDPHPDLLPDLVAALEDAGADIIELGLPFSDPLADGAVNQAAADRALRAGTTTRRILEEIARIRQRSEIPLVLFTYLNPIYTFGFEAFHQAAAEAGADAVLTLDLPPDEAAANPDLDLPVALQRIRLVAPTTPPDRLALIARHAEGFLYCVSREGVTGTQDALATGFEAQLAALRPLTDVPLCVGFGIHRPDQAAAVARVADGVVVGSAIVQHIATHANNPDLTASLRTYVALLAEATHRARA